jgi:formylmethanofuran dehydrogenase subunit D
LSERFTLITGRTKEQGQARHGGELSTSVSRGKVSTSVGRGKASPAYQQATAWIQMNTEDMARMGIAEGQVVHAWTSAGEADLPVRVGELPTGMAFVPVGPAASRLSGAETDSTGMPLLKGLAVVITAEARQPVVES